MQGLHAHNSLLSAGARTGGIDLGGTKIEARLFDENWQVLDSRRVATPTQNYDDMLGAIVAQIQWLEDSSDDNALPVGIGVPGFVRRATGCMLTANLPATGKPMPGDLNRIAGRPLTVINDCRAFTLSEAVLGAGRDHASVVGLVMGTGLAGGHAVNGVLVPDLNGLSGEYGHIPLPSSVVAKFDLPIVQCGCGRMGCFETFAAGPGLARLIGHMTGQDMTAEQLATGVAAGDPAMTSVLGAWLEIMGQLIGTIVMTSDPDCIVLGGGVSNIAGVATMLSQTVAQVVFDGSTPPKIRIAQGGDSSGTRGAALAARAGVPA